MKKIRMFLELILFGRIRADAAIIDGPNTDDGPSIRFYAEDKLILEIHIC